MIRYTFFVLTILGTAATAIASIAPSDETKPASSRNIIVIKKNQDFPVYGPIVVEQCAVEDCSDVE
jgi:hypothetical protein